MLVDWNQLSEPLQLAVSRAALCRAAQTIATQAEALAAEMDAGLMQDRGGPEALRLLAALIRVTTAQSGVQQHGVVPATIQAMPTAGNA